jgi:hypothetical protein
MIFATAVRTGIAWARVRRRPGHRVLARGR